MGTLWHSWLIFLHYKPECTGFDYPLCYFFLIQSSGLTMALESTQPLTEMGTRNISWGVKAVDAFWEPHSPRTLRVCPGLYKVCFTTVSSCSVLMLSNINREYVKDIWFSNVVYAEEEGFQVRALIMDWSTATDTS